MVVGNLPGFGRYICTDDDPLTKKFLKKQKDTNYVSSFKLLYPVPGTLKATEIEFYKMHKEMMNNGIQINGKAIFLYGTSKSGFDLDMYCSFAIISPEFIINNKHTFDFSKQPNEELFDKFVKENGIKKINKSLEDGISGKEPNQLVLANTDRILKENITGFLITNFHGKYEAFILDSNVKKIARYYENNKVIERIVYLK